MKTQRDKESLLSGGSAEGRRKVKLLYIDFCAKPINPTNGLILPLLRRNAEVVCYGPGFIDDHELKRGLDEFKEKHQGFDFYVTTMLHLRDGAKNIDFFNRYISPGYPPDLVRAFVADLANFLKKSTEPKIFFLTGWDVYATTEEDAQLIADTNGYFVAWADGFSLPINQYDFSVLSREEFFARYKGRIVGRWYDIAAKYRHKFINFGHFIADTEFDWSSLSRRQDKALVPGQMYVRREAVRRELARRGILARSGRFKLLMSAMDHVGLRPYTRPLVRLMYNQIFVQSITQARYAYTEGSGYDYPIRKYFEIPALGAVLLCTPCAGFQRLGFVDRNNAVVVTPNEIGNAIEWLRKSPIQAQEIAEAGRQLIWKRHSLHARADQFGKCLNSIISGRFAGSHWDNGDFVVEETSGASPSFEMTGAR